MNEIEKLKKLVLQTNQYTNQLLHNPEYHDVLQFVLRWSDKLDDSFYTLKTKIFWVLHDIHDFPKCKTCGKHITDKNIFRLNQPEIYNYCSIKCMRNNPEVKENVKKKLIEKYGVDNVFKLDSIKEKSKNALIEKYGVDHYSKSNEWLQKVKQTNNIRFGVDFATQSINVKEKTKHTNIERYGYENVAQVDKFKDKFKQTCIEKYGVNHPAKTSSFQESIKRTKKERYGSENFNNRDKAKQTCLNKYGVENPGTTFESISKAHRKLFYCNRYFSSTPELAYFIWLTDNHIEFEYQPKNKMIEYMDCKNVKHRYYPDFFIVKTGELHEIKGINHFKDFDKSKPMVCINDHSRDYIAEAKHQCMIEHHVKIITNDEYKIFLKYCQKKFDNSNWYKLFKSY